MSTMGSGTDVPSAASSAGPRWWKKNGTSLYVAAGRDHDVEIDLLGHALDARDVAPQADNGRVDDRADAGGGQRGELRDGVRDPRVLAAPLVRIVLLHVGRQHEDVLVHEHLAERGGVDGAGHGLDLRHCSSWRTGGRLGTVTVLTH
jgi:hypothetical protein